MLKPRADNAGANAQGFAGTNHSDQGAFEQWLPLVAAERQER
jgi:hypothetical protein